MTNLNPAPAWDEVPQLELTTIAAGGPNGAMNSQAKALAARTELLKQEKADRFDIVQGQYSFATMSAFNAAKATIPANSSVTIDEAGPNQGANIWNGTTLTKSAYDPLTQARNSLKTNATFARSNVTPIAIDTTAKTLTISAGLTISSNLETNFEVVAQSISIPAVDAAYLLCYDRSTQTASLKTSKIDAEYVIGYVSVLAGVISAKFDFNYTIDGQSIFNQRPATLYAAGSNINIDTVANKLNIITGTARLVGGQINTVIIGATSITLPASDGFYQLRYNLKTAALSLVSLSSARTYLDVDCGVLQKAGDLFTLFGVPVYTVNGKAPSDNVQFGYLSTNVANRINFNTVAGTLTTTSGVRLIVDERSYLMPDGSVALPSNATDTMYNLSYDIIARTVHISAASSSLNKNRVIFGQLLVMTGSYYVFGIPLYQQDGITSLDKLKNVSTGVMVASTPAAINFNFAAKTVEIAASTTRLLFGNNNPLLSTTTVDISANPDVWGQLVYNTATGAFSKKRTTDKLTNSEIRVALFHVNNKEVRDVPWYSINGAPASGSDKTDLKTAEFIIPYGDVEPTYNQPDLAAYATLATTNDNDFTKIYDMYDALVAAHPDYITKTLLGNDGQGSPIYQYQFNMLEVPLTNEANTKPKVILASSVHGYEKAGVYNLYFTMKEICERWASDSKLEALKWGVNFLIIPIAVPSGFTLNQRKNHNGVDIARNFTAGWTASDISSDTYSGAAPLDQAESIILDAFMSNNRDAIYFGSHHNFFAQAGGFIWNASGTEFGVNLCKMLCIRETVKSKQRYSWMPQTNDYYIGYANVGAPIGSEGKQAVEMYGINGGTFEICERFLWESGSPRFSSAVATVGVESFINWILLNVKHACALYNSRINL